MKHNIKYPKTPSESFNYAMAFDTEVKRRMRDFSMKCIKLVNESALGDARKVIELALKEEFDRLALKSRTKMSSDDILDFAAITLYQIRENLVFILLEEETQAESDYNRN